GGGKASLRAHQLPGLGELLDELPHLGDFLGARWRVLLHCCEDRQESHLDVSFLPVCELEDRVGRLPWAAELLLQLPGPIDGLAGTEVLQLEQLPDLQLPL